jgi:ferredoxin
MKIKWRVVFIVVSVMLVGLFISCSDSLDKTISFNKLMRVEYSHCTGCLECINDFSCPEGAIKIDERTQTVYIDADLCTQCMDCINLFNCPEDAFTIQPDEVGPAGIDDFTVVSDSIGKLNLQFTATGDDSLSGRAFRYELILKKADGEVLEPEFEIPLPPIAGNLENWDISNLPEFELITMELQAFDEIDNSSPMSSSLVTIMGAIIDTIPPSSIQDISIDNIEMNSFRLNWTAVGDDDMEGTATFYIIKIHTEEITEENWEDLSEYAQNIIPQPSGSQENLVVIDLEPETDYFAAIKAADEANNISSLSNVVQATTSEIPDTTAPSAITDLSATPTDLDITLTWTSPGDDGNVGTAYNYEIRISETEITEENWENAELLPGPPWPLEAGSLQDYLVEDIEHNITYYFAIKAFDESQNVSELSNVSFAMLIEDIIPPSDIIDLEVVEGYTPNLHTINIRWTAPGDNGNVGTAAYYNIRYALQPIDENNWDDAIEVNNPPDPEPAGTLQNCSITGLDAATIYYFAIKAFDENNNSSNVSNSPGGKLVYQINTAACHNCSYCIYDCPIGAIHQGAGYKYIDPDECDACGICTCPYGLIFRAVVAY